MSSIKYATEDNIRYLITLIKNELENYVLYDTFRFEIDKLSNLGSSLSFEKVNNLPNNGDSNVIYLVPNGQDSPNAYTEYFWDAETQNFELLGTIGSSVDSGGESLLFKKVYALPDHGETNVIYLIQNADSGMNIYDEYFWDEETQTFEMLGNVDTTISFSQIDTLF